MIEGMISLKRAWGGTGSQLTGMPSSNWARTTYQDMHDRSQPGNLRCLAHDRRDSLDSSTDKISHLPISGVSPCVLIFQSTARVNV